MAEGIEESVERVQSRRLFLENGKFVEKYGQSNFIYETDKEKERFYELKAKNETFVLRIRLDSGLVSSNFQIENVDGNSLDTARIPSTIRCHFTGNIVGERNSTVILDICRGLVSS